MPRWGKTRYPHAFSRGRGPEPFGAGGSWRGPRAPELAAAIEAARVPHVEGKPSARVARDILGLRVWEVLEAGMRIRIACDNCQHETLWTHGYMVRKLSKARGQTMLRLATRLRCAGCRSNSVRVWRG